MNLNPINHYNPIIAPPNQNPRSATGDNMAHTTMKLRKTLPKLSKAAKVRHQRKSLEDKAPLHCWYCTSRAARRKGLVARLEISERSEVAFAGAMDNLCWIGES
jgi:hypothetical protein